MKTNATAHNLRLALGSVGLSLPFLLWAFNEFKIERSLSSYYLTDTAPRDIFVGSLVLFGAFLLSYRGYPKDESKDQWTSDNFVTNMAGISILITALVPTETGEKSIVGIIHLFSAGVFFLLMGYMSFQHFTRGQAENTIKKIKKLIYRISGIVIWACILFLAYKFVTKGISGNIVFWIEVVALECFAFSWLLKGIDNDG